MLSPTLFAQSFPGGLMGWLIVIVFFVAIAFFSMLLVLVKQYKRCPSNRILVIWGRGKPVGQASKTIHAGRSSWSRSWRTMPT